MKENTDRDQAVPRTQCRGTEVFLFLEDKKSSNMADGEGKGTSG